MFGNRRVSKHVGWRPNDILPPTLIHSHTLAIPGRGVGSSARTVSIEIVAVHAPPSQGEFDDSNSRGEEAKEVGVGRGQRHRCRNNSQAVAQYS